MAERVLIWLQGILGAIQREFQEGILVPKINPSLLESILRAVFSTVEQNY